MVSFVRKMIENKKEYKNQMARAEALPEDYGFVFMKIQTYIGERVSGDGSDIIEVQDSLLDLFESSVAEGKHVLDVTGEDVAGFADAFVLDVKQWTDIYRGRLNRAVNDKVKKQSVQ